MKNWKAKIAAARKNLEDALVLCPQDSKHREALLNALSEVIYLDIEIFMETLKD